MVAAVVVVVKRAVAVVACQCWSPDFHGHHYCCCRIVRRAALLKQGTLDCLLASLTNPVRSSLVGPVAVRCCSVTLHCRHSSEQARDGVWPLWFRLYLYVLFVASVAWFVLVVLVALVVRDDHLPEMRMSYDSRLFSKLLLQIGDQGPLQVWENVPKE